MGRVGDELAPQVPRFTQTPEYLPKTGAISNQAAAWAFDQSVEELKSVGKGRCRVEDFGIRDNPQKSVEDESGQLFGVAFMIRDARSMCIDQDIDIGHPHGWCFPALRTGSSDCAEQGLVVCQEKRRGTVKICLGPHEPSSDRGPAE